VAATAVYLLDIYGHREVDTLGISTLDLATATRAQHPHVVYAGSHDRALEAVLHDARPGDLVVTMGAGDVNRLGPRILAGLEERCRAIP
jgi:UDP-N-acetylmuramate--alanine ligase